MAIIVGTYWADHHCFHIDDLTDLIPTRSQAEKRRADKRGPESTVIHFHEKSLPCRGKEHEYYGLGTSEVVKTTGPEEACHA